MIYVIYKILIMYKSREKSMMNSPHGPINQL